MLSAAKVRWAIVTGVLAWGSTRADATSMTVTSTADGIAPAVCTLRAAMMAANLQTAIGGCLAGSGDDTITLASGATYTLTQVGDNTGGPNGLPSAIGRLTLNGNGATLARSDAPGTPSFRLLHVAATGALVVHDLTVSNGTTPGLMNGGGIFNTGSLMLINTTLTQNLTGGGGGGAIWNDVNGTLELVNCAVSDNRTGDGVLQPNGYYSGGGSGGGIFNLGTLTVLASTVSNNTTGGSNVGGGDGGGVYNGGVATFSNSTVRQNATGTGPDGGQLVGAGGQGGGIANATLGTVAVIGSSISDNRTGPGGTDGSSGGYGGGINNDGTLVVIDTTMDHNTTGDGAVGTDAGGTGGKGGGIANTSSVTLIRSTISGNATGNGGLGNPAMGSNSAGPGGGIFNDVLGTVAIVNSTISGNQTGSGGCCGGFDGGGGIANSGVVTVASSTISGNSASVDRGGGIINFSSGTVTVNNSIVAANTAANGPDCCGMLTSQGYNLIEAGGDCALAGDLTGNVTGQDPGLGPLRDNGGPTQTQALLPGSPAIDAGNPAGCTDADGSVLTTDQRRAPRSRAGDSRCDIGAYEFAAAVPIACAGDCNGDGVVTIDEILTSVSIALGSFPAAACPSLNSDESAAVTIDEILLAVGYALNGCP